MKLKIKLIFFSHFFVVTQKVKPFEAPQRSVKIKIYLSFFSSSGIGTGRVKIQDPEKLGNIKGNISI